VYFDNLQVFHNRGPILEETHYYPFGLTMAGISTKALGVGAPENRIKFQGQEFANKEFSDDSGLETYGFKWRMHDPQIGRFWQVDPLADKYVYNSTYAFSENKVTGHVELEGLESFSIQDLWRSAGVTNSSDPKQFVKNVGNELAKPKTWIQGAAAAGQIVAPVFLTTLMTGGFGNGAILSAETNALRTTLSTTPTETVLYRAASGSEVTDMLTFGVRNTSGQYETGKLFATTAQDAAQSPKPTNPYGLSGW
jgi:RHS repeat-associated protein